MPYHYIAERHGLQVSLATAKGPTCQQGDILDDSEIVQGVALLGHENGGLLNFNL